MAFRVVYQTKRTNRTGGYAQVFHHPLFGSETQFPLAQLLFDAVNIHVPVAIQDHQIMSIAFVIAEKQVFAMFRIMSRPILFGNFDGWRLRMFQVFKGDIQTD